MRAATEISFRTITTGSTFQWQRIGHKSCSLVWHIQPAQRTPSVTSGENSDCVQVSRKSDCIQSQTGIMGTITELWGFCHVSNISRVFEGDWARAFILSDGSWSSISAYKRVWALLPNHKRSSKWGGMDLQPICEYVNRIEFFPVRRRSTAWDRKWQWL